MINIYTIMFLIFINNMYIAGGSKHCQNLYIAFVGIIQQLTLS
jgi:hypothetical protein